MALHSPFLEVLGDTSLGGPLHFATAPTFVREPALPRMQVYFLGLCFKRLRRFNYTFVRPLELGPS